MLIRLEKKEDYKKIEELNKIAFDGNEEADIIKVLRDDDIKTISYVSEFRGDITGHLMLSPVKLKDFENVITLMGLGPMCVLPEFQKKGTGKALIAAAIKDCMAREYEGIVVLGHPDYYKKFGFRPSKNYNITCEWDVPEDVFMVLELYERALMGFFGTVVYHDSFRSSLK